MLLTKLTLHNFGIYAGRHEIDLTPKEDKPIILFGALNGSGKTTLLEGIQFALFGKFAKFLGKNKSAYVEFLTNAINRRNLQNSASVSVEFTTKRRGKQHKYEVVRTWSVKNNGTANDSVQVFSNGELDIDLSERWIEISETFFPSQLSDLFFFDGERIESLAQPARCSELIRTGLNSLLGLDLVTDLSKTLATLERRLKVEGVSEADRERLTRVEAKISTLTEQRASLQTELQEVFEKDAYLKTHLESLRNHLKQQGGDLYTQRDILLQRQNELLISINSKRAEMVELSSSVLPLALLETLLKEAETLSMSGLTASQKEVVTDALESFSTNILNELSKRKALKPDQIELIQSVHSALLVINSDEKDLPEINLSREAIFRNRTDCSVQKANGLKMILELGKFQTELDQVEKNLLAVPDGEKLKPLFLEIKVTEDESRTAEFSQKSLNDQIQRVQRELDAAQKQFNNAADELQKHEASEIHLAKMKLRLNSGREVLSLFEERIRSKHINTLEKLIKEGFEVLLRKRSFINSISICPQTFSLTINIVGEGFVPASKLSAGERQLLAVAVLWALAQASGRKLPTVIDTPLGRLDSNHRQSFVQNYFPKAGEQVILLSTDEEIVGSYHQALKKHLSHQYLIQYDEETQSSSISTGYFKTAKEPS
uniref:DNA sulfur modification protein DndD n=1 Tax=Flavobacterium sp. TaxID=239 RepID=UPI004047296D